MVFGTHKLKSLDSKRMVEVVRFLGERLPEGVTVPDLGNLAIAQENHAYEEYLRRVYLSVEAAVIERGLSGWATSIEVRTQLRERFHLDDVMPSGFSVFFGSRDAQFFYLLRLVAERSWKELRWEQARIAVMLEDAAQGTPLAALGSGSDSQWGVVFTAFRKLPNAEREKAIVGSFRRVIERTYHELVRARGESRANIVLEEIVRDVQREFGTAEGIAGILDVLPEGILSEERVTLAPRQELAETVRRQMQELRGKNLALVAEAGKLRETVQALQQAQGELQAMTSAQQDFISVVSHQFRTPLAAIRWQGDLLSELATQHADVPELNDAASVVRERSLFLIGILENIFDLLAIESGQFSLSRSRQSIADVITKTCREFTKEAERQKMTLRCEGNANEPLFFDAAAVTRLLGILLMNAIMYSSEGGEIVLRYAWRTAPEGQREALVSVQDNGIGFRPEDRPKIFEKFYRSKNAVIKVANGAGIGLYIAKRIAELHGGKMWAESKGTGLGATFFFTIPERGDTKDVAAAPLQTKAAEPSASPAPIIEDSLLGV